MSVDDVFSWFGYFFALLLVIFAIWYLYTFVWVIIEGRNRDVLNFGLIGVAILGTPFMAAGFVKATKSDNDRILVEYKRKNGTLVKTRLSNCIKMKLNISTIVQVTDINDCCRFCDSSFLHKQELKCRNCGKQRVWFKVLGKNKRTGENELFEIKDLPKLKDEIIVKRILRQRSPS
jgi:hypothetical protein